MMSNEDIRWVLRFENYCDALKILEKYVSKYEELNDLEQDGIIQRFEFIFELAWKVMQDHLKHTGYTGLRGPRPSITQMGSDGLIDPFAWEEILEARNELSHIYNEEKSRSYLKRIVYDFVPEFQKFRSKMQGLL